MKIVAKRKYNEENYRAVHFVHAARYNNSLRVDLIYASFFVVVADFSNNREYFDRNSTPYTEKWGEKYVKYNKMS